MTLQALRLLRHALVLVAASGLWSMLGAVYGRDAFLWGSIVVIPLAAAGYLRAHRLVADLHFRDPDEVAEYLERFNKAQSILGAGVDPPPAGVAAQAIENAAARGIVLSFHHVLDEDLGGVVWEMRAATARGPLPTVRPEHGENWIEILEREGFLRG